MAVLGPVTTANLTAEQAEWWNTSKTGRSLRSHMEPVGAIINPDENAMYHYHRFVMEGASDDLAIMGWRYVMSKRQRLRVVRRKSSRPA